MPRMSELIALRDSEVRALRNEFAKVEHPLREQVQALTVERDRLAARVRSLELEAKFAGQALDAMVGLAMVRAGKLP